MKIELQDISEDLYIKHFCDYDDPHAPRPEDDYNEFVYEFDAELIMMNNHTLLELLGLEYDNVDKEITFKDYENFDFEHAFNLIRLHGYMLRKPSYDILRCIKVPDKYTESADKLEYVMELCNDALFFHEELNRKRKSNLNRVYYEYTVDFPERMLNIMQDYLTQMDKFLKAQRELQ